MEIIKLCPPSREYTCWFCGTIFRATLDDMTPKGYADCPSCKSHIYTQIMGTRKED